jgi:hypothetical protein
VRVSRVPSDVAAVPVRADGCSPGAPAIDASHLSRKYSMVRDIVSAMSLRSLSKRSGGMANGDRGVSSSKLRTKKPMKLEITSTAAANRCEIIGYSELLSFDNNDGNEERRSINNRLTNKYENGLLSTIGPWPFMKSSLGEVSGYA